MMEWFKWLLFRALAAMGNEEYQVCVASRDGKDTHTYHDAAIGGPDWNTDLTCVRCGKQFRM